MQPSLWCAPDWNSIQLAWISQHLCTIVHNNKNIVCHSMIWLLVWELLLAVASDIDGNSKVQYTSLFYCNQFLLKSSITKHMAEWFLVGTVPSNSSKFLSAVTILYCEQSITFLFIENQTFIVNTPLGLRPCPPASKLFYGKICDKVLSPHQLHPIKFALLWQGSI